jgi:peptidyl-tRNA hydrolase, PTH1 family
MFIFVGLGNPGPKYSMSRHNVGFMLIDAIALNLGVRFKDEKDSLVSKIQIEINGEKQDVLLVKPQTFMNLSGQAVQALMSFYKISPEKLLVAHDEVDLPYSVLRLQKNRGHGGHNGVRDIHAKIGSDYSRLRMGVGRPTNPHVQVADFVLQDFTDDEFEKMTDFLSRAAEAVFTFAEVGFEKAQAKVNTGPEVRT